QIELTVCVEPLPDLGQTLRVTAQKVKNKALEVRSLGNIHGGARSGMGLRRRTRTIHARAEKLFQHIVLIGGQYQAADGQTHFTRNVASQNIAEVARWYAERNLLRSNLVGSTQPAPEVIHHLCRYARPVDGVDCPKAVSALEIEITCQGLYDVLTVVEHPVQRNIVDVVVLQRVHLGTLKGAHSPLRRKHEHRYPTFTAHGVFRRRAGVA